MTSGGRAEFAPLPAKLTAGAAALGGSLAGGLVSPESWIAGPEASAAIRTGAKVLPQIAKAAGVQAAVQGAANTGAQGINMAAGTQDATLHPYWSFYGLLTPPICSGAIVPLKDMSTEPTNPNRATNMASISDGTSNTFLVGETDFKPAGIPSTSYGGLWAYGYTPVF